MPDGRFAIIDPVSGISGDMMLGALVAAGASPEWLQTLPGRLGFPEVRVNVAQVDRCGISATKVDVCLPDGSREEPSPVVHSSSHPHQHAAEHHHDHGAGNGGSPAYRRADRHSGKGQSVYLGS